MGNDVLHVTRYDVFACGTMLLLTVSSCTLIHSVLLYSMASYDFVYYVEMSASGCVSGPSTAVPAADPVGDSKGSLSQNMVAVVRASAV